jgi:signal transduction histidine kinase
MRIAPNLPAVCQKRSNALGPQCRGDSVGGHGHGIEVSSTRFKVLAGTSQDGRPLSTVKLRMKISFALPLLLVVSVGIACAVLTHRPSLDAGTPVMLVAGVLVVGALLASVQGILLATHLQRDQELHDRAALLEQRVLELTREVERAEQALADAKRVATNGKTAAAIRHELRNSLNGLGMAVELILEDPSNSARVDRLRPQALSELGHLRTVVESLQQ